MEKWLLLPLFLALAYWAKQNVYEHAYALPSLESLVENSPNRPDATNQNSKWDIH